MRQWLYRALRFSGLTFLFREIVQRRKVTILIFHDLEPGPADRIFGFLSRAYNIIGLPRFIEALECRDASGLPAKALIVTFDDGLKSNYALLPVLRKHRVPATIFLCAGIVGTTRHFWFLHPSVHNRPPELGTLSHTERLNALRRDGFDFRTAYGSRQALSREEIEEMKPHVDFQSHSMFHCNILTCSDEERDIAIRGSKEALEADFGLTVTAFSYPSGDYSDREIALVRASGYKCALSNDPGLNTVHSPPFTLKRLEALDRLPPQTLTEAVVRASGIWHFARVLFGGR